VKRTYQPHNLRRKRTHGFLSRSATPGGKLVLKRRRAKGVNASRCDGALERGLSKKERLLARAEFLRVQRNGTRSHTEHFIVLIAPGPGLNSSQTRDYDKQERRFGGSQESRETARSGIFSPQQARTFSGEPRIRRRRRFHRQNAFAEPGLDEVTKELLPCCRKSRFS